MDHLLIATESLISREVLAALGTGIGAGFIALWRYVVSNAKETRDHLAACRLEHEAAQAREKEQIKENGKLAERVANCEGLVQGYNQARDDVRTSLSDLSAKVMGRLHGDEDGDATTGGGS